MLKNEVLTAVKARHLWQKMKDENGNIVAAERYFSQLVWNSIPSATGKDNKTYQKGGWVQIEKIEKVKETPHLAKQTENEIKAELEAKYKAEIEAKIRAEYEAKATAELEAKAEPNEKSEKEKGGKLPTVK